MGVEVAKTFMIYESQPVVGEVHLYELWIDDQLAWSGAGDDRADAFPNAILSATGDDDELPDN